MKKYGVGAKMFIASIVLCALFLGGAASARAVSNTELLNQIQHLLQVIAQLQAQLGTTQGGQSTSCVALTRTLYVGLSDAETGGEVTKLQRFLGMSPTGFYGPMTEGKVRAWQAQKGIVSSGDADTTGYGLVGVKTRAMMNVCAGSSSQEKATTKTPSCTIKTSNPNPRVGETFTISWVTRGLENPVLVEHGIQGGGNIEVESSGNNTYTVYETGSPIFGIGQPFTTEIALCKVSVNIGLPSSKPSVTVTSPNKAGLYFNESLTVSWIQEGSVPKGSKACVMLVSESTGNHFAFPAGGGSCVDIAGEEPRRSVSERLVRTPGYDLAPGAYRALVQLIGPTSSDGKDGALLAQDLSDEYFKIGELIAVTPSIKVTNVTGTDISISYANIPSAKMIEVAVINMSTDVVIHHYSLYQGGSGTAVIHVNPSDISTGTYYLEIQGEGSSGIQSRSFSLTGTAPVCSVTYSMLGTDRALVSWSSTGATSAETDMYYAQSSSYDSVPVNGSETVTVDNPTVFSFWFTGAGGSATCVSSTIRPTAT